SDPRGEPRTVEERSRLPSSTPRGGHLAEAIQRRAAARSALVGHSTRSARIRPPHDAARHSCCRELRTSRTSCTCFSTTDTACGADTDQMAETPPQRHDRYGG